MKPISWAHRATSSCACSATSRSMVCWGQCRWSATPSMCCGARTGETCGCYGNGWSVNAGGSRQRRGYATARIPAPAYVLPAHTSDEDGETSCHESLLDQLALRILHGMSQRLVWMVFQLTTATAACRLYRSEANCFVLESTVLWLTLR